MRSMFCTVQDPTPPVPLAGHMMRRIGNPFRAGCANQKLIQDSSALETAKATLNTTLQPTLTHHLVDKNYGKS